MPTSGWTYTHFHCFWDKLPALPVQSIYFRAHDKINEEEEGANWPDARVINFFNGHEKLVTVFRCLGDSVELVSKLKEVAVCPDRYDLTTALQTRDRTRQVCTLSINYTYLLSLGMDQLVWCMYSTNSSWSRSQSCPQWLASHPLSNAKIADSSGIWPVSAIVLNLVMRLPWEKFEILIFRVGASRSFPSPPPLHYLSCAPAVT